MKVLDVRGLSVTIGPSRIVRDVSWAVEAGQTLGIVGESGSGKSMTVLAATGLMGPPRAQVDGEVLVRVGDDEPLDLLSATGEQRRRLRGRHIGFVFQDPSTSLNPMMTVGRQITEGPEAHLGYTRRAARQRALDLLDLVGIPDPERRFDAYPHELSGGMRQRVMIAIALACDPEILVADEATTALDVTIQAQILDAVKDLRERLGTAVVWISHDLAVVGGIADEVAVMYGGEIVEQAETLELFRDTAHPYTHGLFEARPTLDARDEPLATIPGAPPDPRQVPPGCVFWDRCPIRGDERCATEHPELREIAPGHLARSFYDPRPHYAQQEGER